MNTINVDDVIAKLNDAVSKANEISIRQKNMSFFKVSPKKLRAKIEFFDVDNSLRLNADCSQAIFILQFRWSDILGIYINGDPIYRGD